MRSLKEQIENKCIHFTGVMNKECDAGINYESVREGRPFKFPCLKQGGQCLHSQFPSEEEVNKRIEEIEQMSTKGFVAYAAIKKHYTETKEPHGKIPCECGGDLNYSVASTNGHIWGKCLKCGISFNE